MGGKRGLAEGTSGDVAEEKGIIMARHKKHERTREIERRRRRRKKRLKQRAREDSARRTTG